MRCGTGAGVPHLDELGARPRVARVHELPAGGGPCARHEEVVRLTQHETEYNQG
jgi:hypothetical protein